MPRLTAREIHSKEFKRSVRGYDVDEVNDFLDQIIKDYIEFENILKNHSPFGENDHLSNIEHLLEQLLYDVQQLREENRLLREQLASALEEEPYEPSPYYR
jgi:DivIVA domain-containing protein